MGYDYKSMRPDAPYVPLRDARSGQMMAGGAKMYNNPMQGWGLTRFFGAMSVVDTLHMGATTGINFMQDVQDDNPYKFQRLGAGLGGTFGAGVGIAAAGWAAMDEMRRVGGADAFKYKGTVYGTDANGKFGVFGGQSASKAQVQSAQRRFNSRSMFNNRGFKPGVFKGGKFIGTGWKKDLLWMAAAPAIAGITASIGGSMVGAAMDDHFNSQKAGAQLNYDTRFFDTRRYDQTTFQQTGNAMEKMQERMLSVARIYHSR